MKTIARLAKEKESLSVVADQYGSPTSATSIVEVLIKICKAQAEKKESADERWGLYHYTDFPLTTWHQLAVAVVKDKGLQAEIKPITTDEFPTLAKRPKYSGLNVSKIKKVFDIGQVSWMEKLKEVDCNE